MTVRKISLDEVRTLHFPAEDVLTTFHERYHRRQKLLSAMAQTNNEHEAVWILLKLADGEFVEIDSTLIDLEENYVEVHGGFGIPITAVYDVGV